MSEPCNVIRVAGIYLGRKNLMSIDVRFWRPKLYGLANLIC